MSKETINSINSFLKNEPEGFIRTLFEDILNSHKRLTTKPTVAEFYSKYNTKSPDTGSNITPTQVSELHLLKNCFSQLNPEDYPQVSYQIRKALHTYNLSKEKNGLDDYFFKDNKLKSKQDHPKEARNRIIKRVDQLLQDLERVEGYNGYEYIKDALHQSSKYYQMVELLYEFKEELKRDDYDEVYTFDNTDTNNNFGIPPYQLNKPVGQNKTTTKNILLEIMDNYGLKNCNKTINTLNL